MVEEGGDELREGDGEVLDLSDRGDRSEAVVVGEQLPDGKL